MSTDRCVQCGALIAADAAYCTECGYPPEWQDDLDDTSPNFYDVDRRAQDPVPGEDPVTVAGPGSGGHGPSAHQSAEERITCRSCGASNPAGRTLCDRCGMGLAVPDDNLDDTPSRWQRPAWILLLALFVLAGIALGRLLLGDTDSQVATGETADPVGAQSAATSEPAEQTSEPAVLLREGDTGDEVSRWQELLVAAGIDVGTDGSFGPATREATSQFQRSLGEEPTGEVTRRAFQTAERAEFLSVVDVFVVRAGGLEAVSRRVDETQLARGAMQALLDAPLPSERDDGLSSAIPPGTALGGVEVGAGTATVGLDGFAADPEPDALRLRVDQVVRTATQFPSIDRVLLRLPPQDAAVFADAGVVVDDPLRGGGG